MQVTCFACRKVLNVDPPKQGKVKEFACGCGCEMALENTKGGTKILRRIIKPAAPFYGKPDLTGPFQHVADLIAEDDPEELVMREVKSEAELFVDLARNAGPVDGLIMLEGYLEQLEEKERYEECRIIANEIKSIKNGKD